MKASLIALALTLSTPVFAAPKEDVHALAQEEIAVFGSQDLDGMDTAIVHFAAMGAGAPIVPDLIKALGDKLPIVRPQTAAAVAKMGPVAKASVARHGDHNLVVPHGHIGLTGRACACADRVRNPDERQHRSVVLAIANNSIGIERLENNRVLPTSRCPR